MLKEEDEGFWRKKLWLLYECLWMCDVEDDEKWKKLGVEGSPLNTMDMQSNG